MIPFFAFVVLFITCTLIILISVARATDRHIEQEQLIERQLRQARTVPEPGSVRAQDTPSEKPKQKPKTKRELVTQTHNISVGQCDLVVTRKDGVVETVHIQGHAQLGELYRLRQTGLFTLPGREPEDDPDPTDIDFDVTFARQFAQRLIDDNRPIQLPSGIWNRDMIACYNITNKQKLVKPIRVHLWKNIPIIPAEEQKLLDALKGLKEETT